MKTGLLIVGVLALLCGLVWFAQGAGYFPYPASSFMINSAPWIYIGLAVAAVGAVTTFIALKL
jgi:hypothetical protein